jgi:DNA-binding response OmpR family regulator
MMEVAAERKRGRVLIADDDRDLVRGLSVRLISRGFDVSAVHDGSSAVRAALKLSPDAIILDIRMPEMNGFQVLQTLGDAPNTANIPVIVLSANVAELAKSTALRLGATEFMTKPFGASNLMSVLESMLETTREPVRLRSRCGS